MGENLAEKCSVSESRNVDASSGGLAGWLQGLPRCAVKVWPCDDRLQAAGTGPVAAAGCLRAWAHVAGQVPGAQLQAVLLWVRTVRGEKTRRSTRRKKGTKIKTDKRDRNLPVGDLVC